jgi:(p)ppGpp synthase/HD superfamily hydrolase
MIKSEELKKYLDFAYSAYQENNASNQAYRQLGKVPFIMHPLWCASMLIADTEVPFEQRELGLKALILHDVLEDTSLGLPEWVEPEVKEVVKELTFEDLQQAIEKYPSKRPFIKLLLLYDKLSSMYEKHVGITGKTEEIRSTKRKLFKELTLKGIEEVEKEYGNIRIVQVGKAIAENTDW